MKLTKIFTAEQIKNIDRLTIKKQNISSLELMERAVENLLPFVEKEISKLAKIHIYAGVGNNGGDGLVLARKLYEKNYNVRVSIVEYSSKHTEEFHVNLQKLKDLGIPVDKYQKSQSQPNPDFIVDAIFGVGLNRPAQGIAREAIEEINASTAKKISIDVPSGMYADQLNQPGDAIVQSHVVFTFQFPKLSFFFKENEPYINRFEIVDIGLDAHAIEETPTPYYYLIDIGVFPFPRKKFSSKRDYGHAMIIGGSMGKAGAVMMASIAAFRSGAGWTSVYVPKGLVKMFQTAHPEIMVQYDEYEEMLTGIRPEGKNLSIAIGPGMGTHQRTQQAIKKFLENQKKPVIIDADALNILAQNPQWLSLIPPQSILTPHEGELKRLKGSFSNTLEKWEKAKQLASDINGIVVAKGAYSLITNGEITVFNSTGNPALAKAGSGDVLTGILAGIMAQNRLDSFQTALTAAYVHGKLADMYVRNFSDFSLSPLDLIEMLKNYKA